MHLPWKVVTVMTLRAIVYFLSLSLLCASAKAEDRPDCSLPSQRLNATHAILEVDKVWAGTRVDFTGTATGNDNGDGNYLVGYYDQDRWLTIAKVNAFSHEIRRTRLQSRFAGWDSHNSVALATDRNGMIHVAANMHANKLNYFRLDSNNLGIEATSIPGAESDLVTYPQFLRTADDNLLFINRNGRSGDGSWTIRQWNGSSWTLLNEMSFIGGHGFGTKVSGYPSRFYVARDGFIHLAIVWRLTPDASTNVAISYAKTRDFRQWFDSRNQPLQLPLSPDNSDLVLRTGPNQGLLNNAVVSIDPNSRPIITFTRYDAQGHNTVELMKNTGGKWQNIKIAVADGHFAVEGTGSLPRTVALSEVNFAQPDAPSLYYHFPDAAGKTELLDSSTLLPRCVDRRPKPDFGRFADRALPTMRPQIRSLGKDATLVWAAQPANNDRQPACTPEAPRACNPPPSTLKLVIDNPDKAP